MKMRILVSAPKGFSRTHATALKKAVIQTLKLVPPRKTKILRQKSQRWELSIGLVTSAKIRKLNAEYRKKNRPTDVLSFPFLPSALPPHPQQSFGEILICLSIAKKQAALYGQSLKMELERLTVHGTLHLLGYDHELGKKQEREMFHLQDRILKSISSKHLKT